ncbi:peptidylprolyl isomerase [Streptomyces sp. H27-C3]|uniref:peptidylprolyl isomerase n=1 Tax=Streptomyces sp. H27-C3 TaxID=3046305 RepID=UPI0024B95714|nr:peptidylprolyl isomerase [Streptomyces sp. H27-C3]MDJ0464815.1 peptidylprolyl isomerase [Streptomyces sp. H27-C3]
MVNNDQRRRQLAREKFERQQLRRAAAKRKSRRRNAVIASALAVVLAAGAAAFATGSLSGDDKKDDGKDTVADSTPSVSPSKGPDPCEKPAAGAIKKLSYKKEPALTIDKSAAYTMKLQTTCGDITLGLDAAKAPRTVNSFNFLASKGYFDHTKCHRLTTNGIFVLQCGDPTAQGSGTPGYKLPDENLKDPKLKGGVYPAGTVAMANAGPGTGGSQFFLVYQDSKLPANYTPFGTIKGGQDVLKKIAGAGEATGQGDGAPNATVVIDKATVTK